MNYKKRLLLMFVISFFIFTSIVQNSYALMAKIPQSVKKLSNKDKDRQILRVGMIAELDAINLYEQMAQEATNKHVKKVLLDIAKEEKTHIGEFEALLLSLDKEQEEELAEGKREIQELLGK
jgi:rubrerythrin